MIQVIVTQYCPDCGSANIVKNGTDDKGAQKFRCNDCETCGTLDATGRYTSDHQAEILRASKSGLREACVASGAPLAWPGRLWPVG
jgi:transposase-like protein